MTMTLQIGSLSAGYGGRWILQDISLAVEDRQCVCVIGSNAAGKTTLLRSISRQTPDVKGSIVFNGHELTALQPHQVPLLGIAHVPEGRQIFPELTVRENLMLGSYAANAGKPNAALVKDQMEYVNELFPRLFERRNQVAGTMSGGEQQMVAIGRALMLVPAMLMLDEPTHGLSPALVEEIYEKIIRIRDSGISILLIEQNAAKALEVSDKAYVIEKGSIVMEDTPDALMNSETIRNAYLGV